MTPRTPTKDPVTNPTPEDVATANMPHELVLARLGHYSYLNVCHTALVVHADEALGLVNVVEWDSDGDMRPHSDVAVVDLRISPVDTATFHLTRECPWGR